MKAVMRAYRVFVLLDCPPKPSFSAFFRWRTQAKLVWFTPRAPFWAKLLDIKVGAIPKIEVLLLWELARIPNVLEGKMLTLVPLTPRAREFVQNHRSELEISYCLERENA